MKCGKPQHPTSNIQRNSKSQAPTETAGCRVEAQDLAFCILHSAFKGWLPDMDLNHDKQIQSLLCYRYTIGQTGALKIESCQPESSRTIEDGASQDTRRAWTNLLSLAASGLFRVSDFGFRISPYAI